ncbi:MAG TPA: transglutaminase-like domain-containing protein [Candidatus Polarisedimenticolia bacterium]
MVSMMSGRRERLAAVVVAAVLVTGGSPGFARQAPGPKAARFRVETRTYFGKIPREAQSTDCWLPIPFPDVHQRIEQLMAQGPFNISTNEIADHQTIAGYLHSGPRGGVPMQVLIGFFVERTEQVHGNLEGVPARAPGEEDRKIGERWLKPDPTGLPDDDLRSRASKIASKEKTALGKARAIFEYVVANVALLSSPRELQGAGLGNLSVTLKMMKGDSLDMAAAFVALCRAAGVPARTVTGWKFPAGIRRGSVDGYYGWAEFYLPGTGWIPVDPAEARRNPTRKAYSFGSVDERRLALAVGREVHLNPPQAGVPLNYFINPYWECDGKTMPDPRQEVQYEEVAEIPSSEIQLRPKAPGSPPSNPPPNP